MQRGNPEEILGERGVTSIEFAFVLPILLLIVFGLVDFGRAIWTQTTLDYAVQAAARCEAISPTLCTPDLPTYAANHAFALPFTSPNTPQTVFSQSAGLCSVDSNNNPTGVQVRANYRFLYIFPLFHSYSGPFVSIACYPR